MSLGSTHLVMDDGGAIAQGLSFDPFGRRRSDGAGLVHMNGPVYDPTLGRFISADPFIQAPNNTQSHNRYSYSERVRSSQSACGWNCGRRDRHFSGGAGSYRDCKSCFREDPVRPRNGGWEAPTETGVRDRAFLEVLYSTGIRRQEVINLSLPDINTSAGVLAVRQGKGKKDRFVPVGERALIWIEQYVNNVRLLHRLPSSPNTVFLDETGKPLDPHKVSRAVKKYVKQANVDKEGSCHLFRHTMATLMLENGADIHFIQQILGHAMLSTTEIYTHLAIHKLKEIHTATHAARAEQYHTKQSTIPTEQDVFDALHAEAATDDEKAR